MVESRKQHCWECLHRCLVCDSTRPECKRCSSDGIACPGYNKTKPARLRWLPPGRITSRKRTLKSNLPTKPENYHNHESTIIATEVSRNAENINATFFQVEAELRTLIQAAEYYNNYIHQDLLHVRELGPNPYLYPISPTHVQKAIALPNHIQYGFVCMTISHQINRAGNVSEFDALATTYYRYRSIVIRSLNEDINAEQKRTGDIVLAGIMNLLLADAQQGVPRHWRWHLEGIQRVFTLRGGIRKIVASKHLESLLLCFLLQVVPATFQPVKQLKLTACSVAVIGNTTSPASDLVMTRPLLEDLEFIIAQYGDKTFAFQLFPPPLFAEIIRINYVRMRAIKYGSAGREDLLQESYEILSRIYNFSPEQWIENRLCAKADWLVVGKVYQAAAIIYCISSLQSLMIFPTTSFLGSCCAINGTILQDLLSDALKSPRIKRFMLWPLVVLGVEAVKDHGETRAFVQQQFPELSRHAGVHAPLMAKGVLERFWASSESHWDACFDRPYAFSTQIAVDISRISPEN